MGWGVQVTTDIYVSRVRKDDVQTKIEENEELIKMFEKELFMLVSANPREIASDESREHGDIVQELRLKVDELLQAYKECLIENKLLQIVLEDIDKAEDC
jgi:hypothetical protein